jgi:hypothetical protein
LARKNYLLVLKSAKNSMLGDCNNILSCAEGENREVKNDGFGAAFSFTNKCRC